MKLFFIISFFMIMFLVVSKKKNMDGFSKRLIYIYLGYWFLSFFFTAFNVADLNEVDIVTYIMVALHLVFFWLGFSKTVSINKNQSIDLDRLGNDVNRVLNNIFFKIILVIAIIYLASLVALFYERMIYYQSMGDARTEYYEYNLYGPFFGKIQAFILSPLNGFVLIMFWISIIVNKSLSWNHLYLFVYFALYNSLSGGRGGYLALLWSFIFIAFCIKDIIGKHKTKLVIYGVPIIVVFYVLLAFLTAARIGDVSFSKSAWDDGREKLNESLVVYTSGPLVAFDHAVKYNYIRQVGGYKYGGMTLSAPIMLYNIVGRKVGLDVHQALNDVIELKQGTPFEIANGRWYNALYTSCFWYYLDFGFLGLIIFPFLLGWLVRRIIKVSYNYQTLPMMVILYMTYNFTIKSVMDFYLSTPLSLLVMIIIFIWGKRYYRFTT